MQTYEQQFRLVAGLLVVVNATGMGLNYMVTVITCFMLGIGLPILVAFFLYLSWAIHRKPPATNWTRRYCIMLIVYYCIISFLGIGLATGEWFTEIDLSEGICLPGIFPLLNIILLTIILLTIHTQSSNTHEKQIN